MGQGIHLCEELSGWCETMDQIEKLSMDLNSAVKREETTDTRNHTMDRRGTLLMSGPVSEGYRHYSSVYIAFLR